MKRFSVEQLAAACSAPIGNADIAYPHMIEAMGHFQIDTPLRQTAFFATLAVESVNLTKTEESLFYKDAARLAAIYPRAFANAKAAEPYVRNSKALGDLLYKGFWGRGYIQLTWRDNYQKAGNDLGYDYVAEPALVAQPKHAALTAAWYWDRNGCNAAADAGDITAVTRKVNGPALMHLAERKAQYDVALKVLS